MRRRYAPLGLLKGDQTVTGDWTFNAPTTVLGLADAGDTYFGPPVNGGDHYFIFRGDAGPGFYWQENDEGTDEKMWRFDVFSGNLRLATRADDRSGGADIFLVTRGTGTAVTDITFTPPVKIENAAGAELLTITDTGGTAGVANPYIAFRDDEDTRLGVVGFGSALTGDLTLATEVTNSHVIVSPDGAGQLLVDAGAGIYGAAGVDLLSLDAKEAIDGNDTWLRLNQNNDFTSGTYSPYLFYGGGGFSSNNTNFVISGDTVNTTLILKKLQFSVVPGATPGTNVNVNLRTGVGRDWNGAAPTDATNLASAGSSGDWADDGSNVRVLTCDTDDTPIATLSCSVDVGNITHATLVPMGTSYIQSGLIKVAFYLNTSTSTQSMLTFIQASDHVIFDIAYLATAAS